MKRLIIFSLLVMLSGCGTMKSFLPGSATKTPIYSGVQQDIHDMSKDYEYIKSRKRDVVIAVIDFPFSLIMDTALLPITIPTGIIFAISDYQKEQYEINKQKQLEESLKHNRSDKEL